MHAAPCPAAQDGAAINAGLPNWYRIVFEFGNDICRRMRGKTMSAQTMRPTRNAFAAMALVWGLAFSVSSNSAVAGDCLAAPNSPAPANSHWYYRTDRTQQRQCWHLRATNEPSQLAAVPSAPDAAIAAPSQSAAAGPYSLASFKDFIAQRGGAQLSNQEIERLYAEFLEWHRSVHQKLR